MNKIITKPVSQRKQLDQTVKRYIIEAIDSTGYDLKQPLLSDEYKLRFLYSTFLKEYGWAIGRHGEQLAFREWLQGLPSCFNIDFENYKIIELAYAWGSIDRGLSDKARDKREDMILDNWFNFITVKTFQLFKKYGVK